MGVLLVLLSGVATTAAISLLGAGEGRGSCPAPPFRAAATNWPTGCPLQTPCCNEYGYCRTEVRYCSLQPCSSANCRTNGWPASSATATSSATASACQRT